VKGTLLHPRHRHIIGGFAKASAAICFSVSLSSAPVLAAPDQLALADLRAFSIEELAQIEITSVSKSPERLAEAPAAIYVITQEDAERSGATSIPEILRLAPNLHVSQQSPSKYIVAARGFSGSPAAQNLPNKLLVLIDGRSVYTPLYSGVYWDMQDVMFDDLDRVEVISGPGATLWGANAVNGVINITTRSSADTQGGVVSLGAGNLERNGALRYGGRISDDLTYRFYAKSFVRDELESPAGVDAHDTFRKTQGGFRMDWSPESDLITLQGDIYSGTEEQLGAPGERISGGNILGRWSRTFTDGSKLQIQAYYDQTERRSINATPGYILHTYDIEAQYSFALNDWNNVVVGAGDRINEFKIVNAVSPVSSLLFVPRNRTLNLSNFFIEDRISLSDSFKVIAGIKIEGEPYTGVEFMPSLKLAWTPNDSHMLWAAVSRAVRSPTPFDRDVVELLGPTTFLTGSTDFQPEKLIAYELGYRGQLSSRLSLSVSTFLNVYDDLRSIEMTPVTVLPLYWGNEMKGEVYGVEVWGSFQATDWWRLSASFNLQEENLRFKTGASGLLGTAQAGNDPTHRMMLQSAMQLSEDVALNLDLRRVGPLPDPHVPAYTELNARIGWAITDNLEIAASGYNLLHKHHQEFNYPDADRIPRSFFIETRVKF